MATNHTLEILSGSTNGRPVSITSTSGSGQIVHTATSTANTVDVIELFASNEHSSDVLLSLQVGGTTDYTDTIKTTLKAQGTVGQDGAIPLGTFTLNGGAVLRAIAGTASKAKVWGNVKRITNA
jgi:hypothetical protein